MSVCHYATFISKRSPGIDLWAMVKQTCHVSPESLSFTNTPSSDSPCCALSRRDGLHLVQRFSRRCVTGPNKCNEIIWHDFRHAVPAIVNPHRLPLDIAWSVDMIRILGVIYICLPISPRTPLALRTGLLVFGAFSAGWFSFYRITGRTAYF